MKKVRFCLLFLLFLMLAVSFASLTASAEPDGGDELIEEYRLMLEDGADVSEEESISRLGLDSLLAEIETCVGRERGRIGSFFLLLLGVSLLMTLSSLVTGELSRTARASASFAASLAIFSRIIPLITEIASSLSIIRGFFSSLMPLMVSSLALGGAGATSGVTAASMAMTLEISSFFTEKFLFTLTSSMFLVSIAGAYGGGLRNVAKSIKSAFTKGLGLLTTVLIGLVAMQTLISQSADNTAMRAARYAATSTIPLVGGVVAGSLSTLVGGLAYARSVIGGSALAVIVGISLSPLVILLFYRLAFFLAISFLEFCSMDEGATCLSGMRDALDALITIYVMSTVIYILEIIIVLKVEVIY